MSSGDIAGGVRQVSLADALTDVETRHLGGTTKGVLRPSKRDAFGVLLTHEVEGIKSECSPDDLEKALVEGAAMKLLSAGVFWQKGEKPPERVVSFFLKDTQPGLSTLEEDVIRIQVESFLVDAPYDNTLIKASEIEEMKESLERSGRYSRGALMEEILDLAAERDDELDAKFLSKE